MPVLRRRRATDHLEVDTEGSWAISYGDMITLLLTFFILFFSTNKEKDRMEAMETAMIAMFENKAEAGAQALPQSGPDKSVEEKIEAKVHKVGSKLIVEFPEISFYEFGKVDLNAKGKAELKKFIARYLPYAGNYILGIRAYTDNKKVLKGGNRRYSDNLELSALRSISAMRYMQQLGIPLDRMRLGGYGELKLTAEDLSRAIASTPGYSRAGLPLARKVVLIVEPEPREKL
jgi:flagellar motor protein MotB